MTEVDTATSAGKITSFAIAPGERWLFAGTLLGQLATVEVDSLDVVRRVQAHSGEVEGVAVHPTLPYVAALGADYAVTIWAHDGDGRLDRRVTIPLRGIKSENPVSDYDPNAATISQPAIAFHPRERRLLTRGGFGVTLELEFDDDRWATRWCRAFFPYPNLVSVRYLADSDHVLCSCTRMVVVDPRDREHLIVEYRYNKQTIHHVIHLEGSEYLLASGSRRVIRFDMARGQPIVVGPAIAYDDIERVTYNRTSRRAFASSVDGRVFEIDVATCTARDVVMRAPFGLREIETLERAPATLIARSYDGGLYMGDVDRKQVTRVRKDTPPALFAAARLDARRLLIGGDGSRMLSVDAAEVDPRTHVTRYRCATIEPAIDPGAHTRRMVLHEPGRAVLLGRSNGDLVAMRDGTVRTLARLDAGIRDLVTARQTLFAACDDGAVHRLDLDTGRSEATWRSPEGEPIWSLAHNPERKLLAVAEREGNLYLLDAATMEVRGKIGQSRRATRTRWLDRDRLFVTRLTGIVEINLKTGETRELSPAGHVVDFAWDDRRRYLAVVTYRDLALFDLTTLTPASVPVGSFDLDLPTGLVWLDPDRGTGAYPYELIVFGRSGVPQLYRVHNDRMVRVGSLEKGMS